MASDLLNINLSDSQRLGDKKSLDQMTGHVKEVLALFDDHRLQSLCKLHDSPTYVHIKSINQSINQSTFSPCYLFLLNIGRLIDWLVDWLVDWLIDCFFQHLCRFLDRLTKQLEQKMTFCDRMECRAEGYRLRRSEALSEGETLEPELAKLIAGTRKAQKFIEQDISRRYQERRVTILGGAQSLNWPSPLPPPHWKQTTAFHLSSPSVLARWSSTPLCSNSFPRVLEAVFFNILVIIIYENVCW